MVMKKRFIYIMCSMLLVVATACEKDLELYDTQDCRLNFYYDWTPEDGTWNEDWTKTVYSFVYGGSDKEEHTVYLTVETMGFVSEQDRVFELEQVMTGINDAQAGIHYVAFNDPSMKSHYIIRAGQTKAEVPVVLKRDASLKNGDVTLQIRIKDNGVFKPGYERFQTRTLTISDMLTQPTAWSTTYCFYYYGNYGSVKHQFLIDATGERWDDEFIEAHFGGDAGYIDYLYGVLVARLEELNAEREAQGLGVLCESDGTPVVLEYGY